MASWFGARFTQPCKFSREAFRPRPARAPPGRRAVMSRAVRVGFDGLLAAQQLFSRPLFLSLGSVL